MLNVNIKKKLGSVLIDVNFSAQSKGVTAVFGKSGAGKTSVINMIAGLIAPDEGSICFNDNILFDSEKNINIPTYKRNVGYIFQDARLFPHMSVKKNLLYGAFRNSNNAITHNMADICSLLGIEHLVDRMPRNLSGGEKQRVAIGRALLSNPDILLMDEPLASLDRDRRGELLDYISTVSKNTTIPIIYVTHAVEEIIKLAGNLAFMENGKLTKFGNAIDILNELDVATYYAGRNFGVICDGVVKSYNPETEMAHVAFDGGFAEIASAEVDINKRVRFKINASDVVLCASEMPKTSVRNTYCGTITDIKTSGHFANIMLDIGTNIWARISLQSLAEMKLEKGKKVYALVKSATIAMQIVE